MAKYIHKNYFFGILIVLGLLLLLSKQESIKWNGEIGMADLINISLALITLAAVNYSKQAAESARKSTDLSKQAISFTKTQTNLMERELSATLLPKIVPSNKNIVITQSTLYKNISIEDDTDFNLSTLNLNLTNIFKGKAYMVSAWLNIDTDAISILSSYPPPDFLKDEHGRTYQINLHLDENTNIPVAIAVEFNDSNEKYLYPYTDPNTPYGNVKEVLKEEESIEISVPPYVSRLITHYIFLKLYYGLPLHDDAISLNINYKTFEQIDTEEHYQRKFSFRILSVQAFGNPLTLFIDIEYKHVETKKIPAP